MDGLNGLDFSFLGSPIASGNMFKVQDSTPLPLAVNPQASGLYNLQNGILPGEWDWMNGGGNSGNALSALAGVANALQAPKAQAPSLSAPGVGGANGSLKLTAPIARKVVSIPQLMGV